MKKGQQQKHLLLSQKKISLTNWPHKPLQAQNYRLSPVTKRTLQSARINPQDIFPITFAQFQLNNSSSFLNTQQLREQYELDQQRRQKQVSILLQMWKKQLITDEKKKMKKNKSQHSIRQVKQNESKSHSKNSKKSNKRVIYTKHPFNTNFHRNTKQAINKDYYESSHSKNIIHREKTFLDQEESTRSRRYTRQYQYSEYLDINKSSNQRKLSKSNKQRHKSIHKNIGKNQSNAISSLKKLMKKWEMLNQEHIRQIEQLIECTTQKQRKRLLKIHKIQNQQLKYEIQKLRMTLLKHKRANTKLQI